MPSALGSARLQQTAAGLRVSIPAYQSWYLFFVRLITPAIAFSALRQLNGVPRWMMFLLGAMCLVPLARWIWGVAGRQIVTINKVALKIRYDLGGIGWQQEYFVNHISKLKYSRVVTSKDIEQGLDN